MGPVKAVLLDVGGTLWPHAMSRTPAAAQAVEARRLAGAFPSLSPAAAVALAADCERRLTESLSLDPVSGPDVAGVLRAALSAAGLPCEADVVEVARCAFCTPAAEMVTLFPGAAALVQTIRDLGLRSVVVSDVVVRSAREYQLDFEALGLAHGIDAIVTSFDTGFRKPHRAMFDAAIAAAGCKPEACVMIGDLETRDIEPAVTLGMRAIRVCIEQPIPAQTAAHARVTSLHAAARVLRQWATAPS